MCDPEVFLNRTDLFRLSRYLCFGFFYRSSSFPNPAKISRVSCKIRAPFFLSYKGLPHCFTEILRDLIQEELVLRASGTCKAWLYRAHIKFEVAAEDRFGFVCRIKKVLCFQVLFHKVNLFIAPACPLHVVQRFLVRRENPESCPVFRSHV
ncbi:hypothetical protein DSECCO2_592430 [anaerobic digester metagenome]